MENPKAEYGWRPGAVVNVGIRSGTNHTSRLGLRVLPQFRLGCRNAYNTAPVGGSCLQKPSLPVVCIKLPTQLKQFGGVLGGPIKKDKLFFFGGYEGLRSFVGNAFPATVPATGRLSRHFCEKQHAGRSRRRAVIHCCSPRDHSGDKSRQHEYFGCNPSGATFTCGGPTDLIQNGPSTVTAYSSGFRTPTSATTGSGK